jgi:hypothetical protein
MPSVSEATNSSKPPLGNVLAAGVNWLSANQKITFTLYHRYIFPLDGMNYWIKVTDTPVANKQSIPEDALTTYVPVGKEAVQVCPGLIGATNIVGGIIMNPTDATELLFVDFTGPAYSYANDTTFALAPGESIDTPSNLQYGIWVNALTSGHQFSVNIWENIESVNLPAQMVVSGSLHRDSIIEQREDATVDVSTIIFTSLSEVQAFDRIGPDYLYIAHYAGLAFAFSSRGQLYEQADLYHYMGKALFSTNSTQIIDNFADFNPTLIVSNSLPIWLNMPNYVPFYPTFTCPIPLYPSYLVNDDLPPPFGSIHIESTTSLAATPFFNRRMSSNQFCRDEVLVHLYGCDNLIAQDFMAFVEQYSCDWSFIGIANMPVIKDEKHIQAEFKILAQRKSIKFDVNYFQSASRDIARQFIEHVKVQYTDPLELGEQQCQ